ncbi:hypothetical protein TREPR_0346 [Treponema primitia ZAS-2]|uniref:Uncharacterized protein n=1 Tax=Treponema primitia (strain ATCC BAA-887 / DSM 12427 / ZAS-2) TaxID=545694 RepID=F5YN33_TREPZ|nr:hypothetical protein TREPR_0346 [Treponema primitia ZAS-2]
MKQSRFSKYILQFKANPYSAKITISQITYIIRNIKCKTLYSGYAFYYSFFAKIKQDDVS